MTKEIVTQSVQELLLRNGLPDEEIALRNQMAALQAVGDVQGMLALFEGFDLENPAEGFSLDVVEKEALLGVRFLITAWTFRESDQYSGGYVSVEYMLEDGTTGVFNDGSTGVYSQLEGITAGRIKVLEDAVKAGKKPDRAYLTSGRMVRGGLRKSTYRVGKNGTPLPKGAEKVEGEGTASTYYLSF